MKQHTIIIAIPFNFKHYDKNSIKSIIINAIYELLPYIHLPLLYSRYLKRYNTDKTIQQLNYIDLIVLENSLYTLVTDIINNVIVEYGFRDHYVSLKSLRLFNNIITLELLVEGNGYDYKI